MVTIFIILVTSKNPPYRTFNYMTHLLGVFTWLFVYPGNLTVLNRLDSTKCTVLNWTCQSLRILHVRLYVQTTCFSATTFTTRDYVLGAKATFNIFVIQMGVPCLSPIRNCSLGGYPNISGQATCWTLHSYNARFITTLVSWASLELPMCCG